MSQDTTNRPAASLRPVPSLLVELWQLVAVHRPAVRQQRVFDRLRGLVVGQLCTVARHTVTQALEAVALYGQMGSPTASSRGREKRMTPDQHEGPDRTEPFWWGLFAAGGGISAMFTPAHILFQHLLGLGGVPVATSSYARTRRLLMNPLVRLYLLALTSLSLFHWAHRFRYYVLDLGVMGARRAIAAACYGSAIAGTVAAARTLRRPPEGEA